ncbi:PLP-dependent aminotransferase family protein [Hungatella sp. L12]|uniref:PLP-dependent aminotransferase family protein n=1 Tax=Hungatella hominis TaxID=2763050 RepID=A0ABR7H154_9FIRM|nr:PLP-dependent aminotransferase family protein [Hungatella hominis]MBC5706936.1 PLP-dependent aminotransferase family protein [Hungatella hominis]
MWIEINRDSQLTLERQIYTQIRQKILNGMLPSGYKLPSTRKLSSELAVSRNTIIETYSQLAAEGYLKTIKGSGTVVADELHALDLIPSVNNSTTAKQNKMQRPADIIDFRTGLPALEYFPHKLWGNIYREVCNRIEPSSFGYCKTFGVQELQEAIAKYLYRTRGLSCTPRQIVITSGATQGLSLISQILKAKDNIVLIEEPTHSGLRKVITSTGCMIEGVPVDDNGICIDFMRDKKNVSFVYTTPSHQYPMGGVLPIRRRLELIRFAEQNNCYIVEDDYDGEFRYEGPPISSLYELNPQRVIYLGSFSKILAPALRLGFMILPDKLLLPCKKLKMYSDVHTDVLGQYTLAQFIQEGYFEKHIWKMKKLYGRRRKLLLNELSCHFPGQFAILGHATGLHLVVKFHDLLFTEEIDKALLEKGVRIYRPSNYYLEKNTEHDDEIMLGYSHLSDEKIIKGIGTISDFLISNKCGILF